MRTNLRVAKQVLALVIDVRLVVDRQAQGAAGSSLNVAEEQGRRPLIDIRLAQNIAGSLVKLAAAGVDPGVRLGVAARL
jgi:hypothetical protein